MNGQQACELADRAAIAGRYVARKMDEGERVGFENHFVTCAACQRDIALAQAIRGGVAASPVIGRGASPWIGARVARFGAGLAIAAGIVALVMTRGSSAPELARLGNVAEAPVYLGVAVRGTPARTDSSFDRAMDAYRAKNYAGAAAGFRAALAAGEDSVPTGFFLGASQLFANDARAAAESFARVIARGDTPYRDEAQLYEAKALLRLGRGRDALDVLAAHKPADPLFAGILSALSDSVTRLIAR